MIRIGHGYDVHRFSSDRRLILGGVEIPYNKGLEGHSDADVLIHAICDALLGAAALGDIGTYFPDSDPAYLNIDSGKLLAKVIQILSEHAVRPVNIDSTILCEKPRLSPYIEQMRKNIAEKCGLNMNLVGVKATTEEGLGFTGKEEGIAAHAVCLVTQDE